MDKLKKFNLIIISIILLILIIGFMAMYYLNNLRPKKLSIGDNIKKIENQAEDFEIQEVSKGKTLSKVIIKKKLNDSDLKEFSNYTLGSGKRYYLNYTIVLDNNEKIFKTKTIINEKKIEQDFNKKDKNDYIILTAVFFNKDIFGNDYNIGVIQEDYKDNYKSKNQTYYKNLSKF